MVQSIAMYHKNSIKHHLVVSTQLHDQTVLFKTIPFFISHLFVHSLNGQNSSFWQTDWTLSGASTQGLSEPGSNVGVLPILQSFKTETSPPDCLLSYPGYSMAGGFGLVWWHITRLLLIHFYKYKQFYFKQFNLV